MDKEAALACLEEFMSTDDERTLNYEGHGKLIVRSQSNGPTSVEIHYAPDLGYAGLPRTATCNTAEELYAAINSGLKKIDLPDDVADDMDVFIGLICPGD